MKDICLIVLVVVLAYLILSCKNEQVSEKSPLAIVTAEVSANDEQQIKPLKLDVDFYATPQVVVDEMLKMCEVSEQDIVYDLGSGDGRINITAATRYGARGVGIDLDPERIKEANQNATEAGVADKVSFVQGDIFEEDFSEATVLTLYLLQELNLRLLPKILAMKPGTCVVSHAFDMGDWQPDKRRLMHAPMLADPHYIYVWRVPEN